MRSLARSGLALTLLLGGCDAMGGADPADGEGGGSGFAVTGRHPGPGSSGVSVSTYVEVTFSALIDTASVDGGSVLLNGEALGTAVADGKKLRFTPAAPLVTGTSYAITLSPSLMGQNGHLLGSTPVWGFKTAGPTPPPDTFPPLGPRPG